MALTIDIFHLNFVRQAARMIDGQIESLDRLGQDIGLPVEMFLDDYEYLVGFGFVACQAYFTAVYWDKWNQEIKNIPDEKLKDIGGKVLNKKMKDMGVKALKNKGAEVLKIMGDEELKNIGAKDLKNNHEKKLMNQVLKVGPKHENGETIVKLINACANYWKHSPEWDLDSLTKQQQNTFDTIKSLGVDMKKYSYTTANALCAIVTPKPTRIESLLPFLKEWKDSLDNSSISIAPLGGKRPPGVTA